MPELPDILVYIDALRERIHGQRLDRVHLYSPFVLRSVEPPVDAIVGSRCVALANVGKRIAIGFDSELWLVVHLMIAGRLRWQTAAPARGPKSVLAALQFENGALVLTEAGAKRRASLSLVRGRAELSLLDRGGIDVLAATPEEFAAALMRENHTLKRALTDPRLFSGIGNAYSDEILHRARLSPLALTHKLGGRETEALYRATRAVLGEWIDRLSSQRGAGFPVHVTAFRPEMAVHGRFGLPCPDCAAPIQRIRYADNETNYCPGCQTGGRILADRSLSRLLRDDWPGHLDDL